MENLKTAIFSEVRKHHKQAEGLTDDELNCRIFHNGSSLRLTFGGFLILKNIFTVYSFEMPPNAKVKHHIGMSKMEYPYYITSKRFILFSETDAMLIKLHGSVEGFLENYFNVDNT